MSTYAIIFDLDDEALRSSYPYPSWEKAYSEIRSSLESFGFTKQQGNLYFGNPDVNAVQCVLAVQHLSAVHSWFKDAVRDIRMLRMAELSDLQPVLQFTTAQNKNQPGG